MSKRARRKKTQTFALPMAVRASAAGLVIAGLGGWYFFSRPAAVHPERASSVGPVKLSSQVAARDPAPAPAPARVPVPAPRPVETTTASAPLPPVVFQKPVPAPGKF